ncbi:hypothetical protein UFOVP648_28 [uncultured Caudovirales phage]|uniref:Uncharacterized protein n=1 Tax=uncultured Caudovirales phage TaxID=2100421 RepID=A0A6J5NH52_9CAUD|nr:hypothetical protein UFOVP648_28 [uncultured Caudovirales phage]
MATKNTVIIFRGKSNIKLKRHTKRDSLNKGSKNYSKKYRGQGR